MFNDNHIVQYFHCSRCLDELPEGKSPRGYAKLEVGFTKAGIQVRCTRHDMNVVHLDFLGQKVAYYSDDLTSQELS